jgi:hypothetical protein
MDGVAQIVGKTGIAERDVTAARRRGVVGDPRLEQTLYSPHAP